MRGLRRGQWHERPVPLSAGGPRGALAPADGRPTPPPRTTVASGARGRPPCPAAEPAVRSGGAASQQRRAAGSCRGRVQGRFHTGLGPPASRTSRQQSLQPDRPATHAQPCLGQALGSISQEAALSAASRPHSEERSALQVLVADKRLAGGELAGEETLGLGVGPASLAQSPSPSPSPSLSPSPSRSLSRCQATRRWRRRCWCRC